MAFSAIVGGLAAIVCILVSVIFLYFEWSYTFWKRLGVETFKPKFPFGNTKDTILARKHFGENLKDIYDRMTTPYIGIWNLFRPALLIKDVDLIKKIFIKDFEYFTDRGMVINEDVDPLSVHLLALDGEKWKNMRQKLTPTFTSGKIKMMFPSILKIAKKLEIETNKMTNANIDVGDLCSRYTVDLIGSVAFGMEVNSIEHPKAMFKQMCDEAIEPSFRGYMILVLTLMAPSLITLFKLKQISYDVEEFVKILVRKTIKYRENSRMIREDFMQLLIQLRNGGKVLDDGQWNVNIVDEKQKQMTLDEVTAQAYIFLIGGFETSSTTLSFCLFELAKHPEIQEKAYKVVTDVMNKYNNEISYEAANELKYIEYILDETLRMHPVASFLVRKCAKDYPIPNTSVVLPKNTQILLSLLGQHFDEQNFPNPDQFQPERFSPEYRNESNMSAYMPFGEGPRMCIGMRLAKVTMKIGIATFISKFKFELAPGMSETIVMNPQTNNLGLVTPKDGIHLKFTKRN